MVRILECEHRPGEEFVIRLRPPLKSLSPDAKNHFIRANKEVLLSIRGLIDALIEIVESSEEKGPAAKRTKVDIK